MGVSRPQTEDSSALWHSAPLYYLSSLTYYIVVQYHPAFMPCLYHLLPMQLDQVYQTWLSFSRKIYEMGLK